MNIERWFLMVALLSPGCSKLNASFAADTDEGADSNSVVSAGGAATGTTGAATSDSDPTKPEPSGTSPTQDDPTEGDSTGMASTDPGDSSAASDPPTADSGDTGDPNDCAAPGASCYPFAQDCPEGERCQPHDVDDDGYGDEFRCFPQTQNVRDAPCEASCGVFSGSDGCAAGQFCDIWGPNPHCVDACLVEEGCGVGECATEDFPDTDIGLCIADCNPLLQNCPVGQQCILDEGGPSCAADAGNLPPGAPCQFTNDCGLGMQCINGELLVACQSEQCCANLCSVASDLCQGAEVCVPVELNDDGLANIDVGFCAASF